MAGLLDILVSADPPGARIDTASPLLMTGLLDVDVLHVGKTAVILRPVDPDGDDVVVTDSRVGTMPGGLSLPETEFQRWRELEPGQREITRGQATGFASADHPSMHIDPWATDARAVMAAIAHLPAETRATQFSLGILDGRHVAEAATSASPDAVRIVAANIVGLGMGSTPAGDDVLVGVCAGLHAGGHVSAAISLARAAAALAGLTTRSSRLFLRAAAEGRFSERVLWLARSMDSPAAAIQAMQLLPAWGGTSGIDLAVGFLGAQSHVLDLAGSDARRGVA